MRLTDAIADHREQSEIRELHAMRFPTPWHRPRQRRNLTAWIKRAATMRVNTIVIIVILAAALWVWANYFAPSPTPNVHYPHGYYEKADPPLIGGPRPHRNTTYMHD
jgi:hypothetical protein